MPSVSNNSEPTPDPVGGTDLIAIIRQGVKAVPSVKYAVGIAAVAAVVALVVGWNIDVRIALAGVVVMFVLMTVLFVFAALTRVKKTQVSVAAVVFMWALVGLFILWASLLTSSVFFNFPKHPAELFGSSAPKQ